MYIGRHVKYRCYSCQILMELEFSGQILENPKNPYVLKIRPMEVELFHAVGRKDRQTDGQT